MPYLVAVARPPKSKCGHPRDLSWCQNHFFSTLLGENAGAGTGTRAERFARTAQARGRRAAGEAGPDGFSARWFQACKERAAEPELSEFSLIRRSSPFPTVTRSALPSEGHGHPEVAAYLVSMLCTASRFASERNAATRIGTTPSPRKTPSPAMRTHSMTWNGPLSKYESRRACQ